MFRQGMNALYGISYFSPRFCFMHLIFKKKYLKILMQMRIPKYFKGIFIFIIYAFIMEIVT
jgi:hypothetical protein